VSAPRNVTATAIVPSASAERVVSLLRSLSEQTDPVAEAIVVDNASPGGSVTDLCGEFAFARSLEPGRNLGFSAAVNLAARQAVTDAIVVLNDDATCDPGFVAAILKALGSGRDVVMAAGVMRDGDALGLIDTAGVELDRTLLAFDYLNGEPLVMLDRGVPEPVGPSGTAAAYRRDAFLEAGGYDERLFAYWEDVDLALTLRALGGTCALAPTARGTHQHSATLGSGSPRKNYLMGFGRGYLLRKWRVWSPRRAPAILGREAAICLGQIVLDRNFKGITGRVAGTRAAAGAWDYPAEVIAASPGGGSAGSLRRRARRRLRLRSAGRAGAST
jgi:GT2 family glycosyltransferase